MSSNARAGPSRNRSASPGVRSRSGRQEDPEGDDCAQYGEEDVTGVGNSEVRTRRSRGIRLQGPARAPEEEAEVHLRPGESILLPPGRPSLSSSRRRLATDRNPAPDPSDVDAPHERAQGMADFLSRTYEICGMIPYGRVTSYGHIARLAGYPRHSRHVGFAMRDLPSGSSVCWQRIITSSGSISPRGGPVHVLRQTRALEAEGVVVTSARGGGVTVEVGPAAGEGGKAKVDLKVYGWFPESVEFA